MSTNNIINYWKSQETLNKFIFCVLLVIICCCNFSFVQAQTPTNGDIISGEYIIGFKTSEMPLSPNEVRMLAESLTATYGGQMQYVYEYAGPGFAAKFSARAVQQLRLDPRVDYVEPNRVIRLDPLDSDSAQAKMLPPDPAAVSVPWNLDRIDQRNQPLDGKYNYTLNGAGVRIFIIDTGILTSHSDFGGRAVNGYDAVDGTFNTCHGHGTHVAGIAGSLHYGVAKGASLIAVRVLDCNGSGSYAGVMAGVNYVTQQKLLAPWIPAVANMSLGGPASLPLDNAIKASIQAGVTYAVAAGNNGQDAGTYSPARVETALTVGASASNDKKAIFSNFGSCVTLFAPGQDITSTWNSNDTAIASLNGTSMATPHVAGVAALYLQSTPGATPASVKSVIIGKATLDVVTEIGFNSPNLLLFSGVPYIKNYSLTYRAFVDQGPNWQPWVSSPDVTGTTGQSLPMRAMQAYLSNPSAGMGLTYRTNSANLWSPWQPAGFVAGSASSTALPLEAIQFRLTGAPSPACNIRYRSHVAYQGWQPWVDGSKMTGTIGQSLRLEALQVVCTCP